MNKNKVLIILTIALILAILSPILVNYLVLIKSPASRWINFGGEYIGSVIGALTTLFAFYFTFKQNEAQNSKTQSKIDEQMRLYVLPIIEVEKNISNAEKCEDSIYLSSEGIMDKDNSSPIPNQICFKNIGSGTAFDVKLFAASSILLGHFSANRAKSYTIFLPKLDSDDFYIPIEIQFSDIENRRYVQTFGVEKKKQQYKFLNTLPPKLTASINKNPA